jgi:hypothetical protein
MRNMNTAYLGTKRFTFWVGAPSSSGSSSRADHLLCYKNMVFWDVAPCSSVDVWEEPPSILNMPSDNSSEMLTSIYSTTQRHIREGSDFNAYGFENL